MRYQLLNVDQNPKTVKGQKKGFMTAVLYMAPAAASGYMVCAMAGLANCAFDCLSTAGRGGMSKGNAVFAPHGVEVPDNTVQRARIRRTRWFFEDRAGFMAQLKLEIIAAQKLAAKHGLVLVVRLNGTSDLPWENYEFDGFCNIFAAFADVQFYDYTKLGTRNITGIANYHLSFSWSGVKGWAKIGEKALARGLNPVVVFLGKMPAEYLGRPVINGDENDLRFTDPAGVVVGLTAKGRAKKSTSGFAIAA